MQHGQDRLTVFSTNLLHDCRVQCCTVYIAFRLYVCISIVMPCARKEVIVYLSQSTSAEHYIGDKDQELSCLLHSFSYTVKTKPAMARPPAIRPAKVNQVLSANDGKHGLNDSKCT